MEFKSATFGQLKQLLVRLMEAVPSPDTFSFEEMERLLRDRSLPHDFAVMLRRHYNNRPINVIVPEDPILALRKIGCDFFLRRYLDSVKVDMEGGDGDDLNQLKQIISRLSHTVENRPSESALEVISVDGGLSHQGIEHELKMMGYRPATTNEAAGFLQCRSKSFCNPGRSHGPHGFMVISSGKGHISFFAEAGDNRHWEVWVSPTESLALPINFNDVLAAKL